MIYSDVYSDGAHVTLLSETNTKTWLKFTKENLCRCQRERQRSSLVRAQAEKLLRKVALDTWNCVQTVNRKYAVRIMETRDAYHKLLQHAERVSHLVMTSDIEKSQTNDI